MSDKLQFVVTLEGDPRWTQRQTEVCRTSDENREDFIGKSQTCFCQSQGIVLTLNKTCCKQAIEFDTKSLHNIQSVALTKLGQVDAVHQAQTKESRFLSAF